MADRGFDIENDIPNGVFLTFHPFLIESLSFQLKMWQQQEKLPQSECMWNGLLPELKTIESCIIMFR